jgi:hypothetical protein
LNPPFAPLCRFDENEQRFFSQCTRRRPVAGRAQFGQQVLNGRTARCDDHRCVQDKFHHAGELASHIITRDMQTAPFPRLRALLLAFV